MWCWWQGGYFEKLLFLKFIWQPETQPTALTWIVMTKVQRIVLKGAASLCLTQSWDFAFTGLYMSSKVLNHNAKYKLHEDKERFPSSSECPCVSPGTNFWKIPVEAKMWLINTLYANLNSNPVKGKNPLSQNLSLAAPFPSLMMTYRQQLSFTTTSLVSKETLQKMSLSCTESRFSLVPQLHMFRCRLSSVLIMEVGNEELI